MIPEWVQVYNPRNMEELKHALREIVQETALAGLYRGGFFEKAAFYGGTALRIFHGLPRYSEDLDFSLLQPNQDFELSGYLDSIVTECESIGLQVTVQKKTKSFETAIDSAFLKAETNWSQLVVNVPAMTSMPPMEAPINLKIKIEVDMLPPMGFDTEEKLMLKPYSCYVKCYKLPDLFAGKMHALLFRKWKNRVKGRDWFDLEWYIKHNIHLNLDHFQQRAIQSGDLTGKVDLLQLKSLLIDKIEHVSIERVKEDVLPFVSNQSSRSIWTPQYFKDLIEHIVVD